MSSADVQPIEWIGDRVRIIDQTRLPAEEVYLEIKGYRELNAAIKELKIRGAPALGVAAAYAVALGALSIKTKSAAFFSKALEKIYSDVAATRPTAKNLFRSVDRMRQAAELCASVTELKKRLVSEAEAIHREEAEATERLSEFGAGLIKDGFTILTHCNTGSLATTGYGTALGVIKKAFEQGKKIKVIATETRPLLQGARLTCWELQKAGIPAKLITDSMAGYFMYKGEISCVIVGADRIAANGDTANKIGTYMLSVLAKENGVPFYIAAPTTTVDLTIKTGEEIPIEERKPEEVTCFHGVCTSPAGFPAANPAFDVTPHKYITAIITEKGIVREPYLNYLPKVV